MVLNKPVSRLHHITGTGKNVQRYQDRNSGQVTECGKEESREINTIISEA